MRILVVSNLYPPGVLGGYELSCANASEGLTRLGHDVLVLTTQPGIARTVREERGKPTVERSLALAPIFDPEQMSTHPIVVLQCLEARSQWIDSHNAGTLIDTVERFRPDVVYLWNLVGIGGLGLVAMLGVVDVPWVWHLCDRVPFQLCSERGHLLPPLARAFRHLVKGHWILVSKHLQGEIEGLGVEMLGHVVIVPSWADAEGVHARLPDSHPSSLRLAFAGQVAPHKGADIAIDAVIALHQLGIDASLDMWGEVADLSLSGRAAAAGIGDRVRFHGPTTHHDVLEGIADCDVCLFPTWPREPFGMVPLEAAAVGTPSILSDCGVAEFLDDGVHCIKVERTVDGVADALVRIAKGEIDLRAMAQRAAGRVRSDLSFDRILPQLERELEQVARPYRHRTRPVERAYGVALIADRLVNELVEKRWT